MNLEQFSKEKGLTVEQLTKFGVRDGQGGVLIPYYDAAGNQYIRSRIFRDPTPENKKGAYFSQGEAPIVPFGLNRPVEYKKGTVVICEGETDAITLWLHDIPALGLPGATQQQALTLEHVEGADEVIVIEEHDEAGRNFPIKVATRLYGLGFKGKVTAVSLSEKDPRDLYLKHRENFREVFKKECGKRNRHEQPRPDIVNLEDDLGLMTYEELCKKAAESEDWLIEGMLRCSGIVLLAGKPKSGKSSLARNLALSVATGRDFLSRWTKQGPVVWVGLEESHNELRDALEFMGATDAPITFRTSQFHGDQAEWLKRVVKTKRPALVIVDTIGAFSQVKDIGSYSEAVEATRIFLDLRRKYGTAFCLNHHTSKSNNKPLGSSYWEGAVDTALVITNDEGTDTRYINTVGQRGATSVAFADTILQLDSDTGLITATEPLAITERRAVEQDVMRLMLDGQVRTKDEISRTTGKRGIAWAAIYSLVSQGFLVADNLKTRSYHAVLEKWNAFTRARASLASNSITSNSNLNIDSKEYGSNSQLEYSYKNNKQDMHEGPKGALLISAETMVTPAGQVVNYAEASEEDLLAVARECGL